jgi:uncharacterized Ntn-hydrolase superfamily protein
VDSILRRRGDVPLTYSIVGRCERTGQLGVGIATFSLGVGGYCPLVRTGVAALVCQAYGDPRLRTPAMVHLEAGDDPNAAIEAIHRLDEYFEYRQVGIVDRHGQVGAWTGQKTRGWSGHVVGTSHVALGNALDGPQVVDAISRAFAAAPELDLHERLLRGLEAGRDAGGQRLPGGDHMAERSAVLIVHDRDEYPLLDLRIDAHPTAVGGLRALRDTYLPYVDYYDLRIKDPPNTPPPDVWQRTTS